MHVTAVGIDGGDDPVLGGALRDPPRPVGVAGFDVLAGDQGQQPDRGRLLVVDGDAIDGVKDCLSSR